ncbi:MAG: dienelactone hydrolase family protein [Sediminibacterium sp.]
MKKIIAVTCLLLVIQQLSAQDLTLYKKKIFLSGNDTLRYRILYPQRYKPGKAYPLIVFLHGSGERGRDNEAQLMHGGALFVKDVIRKNFPAIVIFPQCPSDSAWSYFERGSGNHRVVFSEENVPTPQRLVKRLMDSLLENHLVNSKRIYLGGLSLGGFGTYDLLLRYPGYFAAAFPICGASDVPMMVQHAKQVPLWIFHGALDNVVSPESDRELYKALMTSGAKDVTYTEYPQAGHNSWDSAFAERKLLPWLFSVKKKRN